MTQRLQSGPLLTVHELAAKLEWTYRRTLGQVQRLDKQAGGKLLVREGTGRRTRFLIPYAKLRSVWVDFDPGGEVTELADAAAETSSQNSIWVAALVRHHQDQIRDLNVVIAALTRRLSAAEKKLAEFEKRPAR